MNIILSAFRAITVFISSLSTAWLVLLSTSIPLYLKNQSEMAHHFELLYPFFWAAIGITSLVSLAYFLGHRFNGLRRFRYVVWLYYIAGALFILISVLRTADSIPLSVKYLLMIALLIGSFVLAAVAYRRLSLAPVVAPLALLSAAFIAVDVSQFARGLERNVPPHAVHNVPSVPVNRTAAPHARLPNIYHIILDEYQTGMFLLTLNEETRKQLSGFHFFPETTTLFGRTGMSMPSIFTGQPYDFETPQYQYQYNAFNSEKSFLYTLQRAGYQTSAFIHKHYDFEQGLFEYIRYHDSTQKIPAYSLNSTFFKLWAYSNFPPPIARKFVGKEYLEQQKNQNVLNPKKPIQSVNTLRSIIEAEKRQSDSGRYVFAHLILPHFPYVLNEDCSYRDDMKDTSALSQSWCATNLTLTFLQELKDLGRYDNSVIIVQSDHGARFNFEDGRIVPVRSSGFYSEAWSKARSRSLLLIKPLHSARPLQTSDFPASLLDIAPTLLGMIGNDNQTFRGSVNLLDSRKNGAERVRYYHFFDKKGRNEWTDEITRYRIQDGEVLLQEKVKLKNNPPWTPEI